MTNTIPNVPRELLERAWRALANSATGREIGAYLDADPCAPECAETCARASMCATCSAYLSAPSPAGVDGLACAAALLLPALRQYMHNDGTGLLAGYDLETTEAIIDGLRGEVECLTVRLDKARKDNGAQLANRAAVIAQRDQQAQRIGELEQILRDLVPGCKWRIMRPRIDAALSAGKDGE